MNVLTNLNGVAQYVRVELAGVDMQEAQEIVGKQGLFEIRVQSVGDSTEHVLYGDSVVSVQTPMMDPATGVWGVGFTLDDAGALALQKACIETGATKNPASHPINMYLDSEMVYSAPLSYELALSISKHPVNQLSASTGVGDEGKKKAQELASEALSEVATVKEQLAASQLQVQLSELAAQGADIIFCCGGGSGTGTAPPGTPK